MRQLREYEGAREVDFHLSEIAVDGKHDGRERKLSICAL